MKAPQRPAPTRQSLAPQKAALVEIATYKDAAGNELKVSTSDIKNYIAPGQNISDSEAYMFLSLCKYQGLNPFLREAYLVKYGSNPATMIVGKDAFVKKAQKNPKYRGMKSGIVVKTEDGKIENRSGEIYTDEEELLGGWAEVMIDGFVEPQFTSVNFREYVQMKDGKPNSMWATKGATMIRKVAVAHVLRENFPFDLSGCYIADEMGMSESGINAAPIEQPKSQPQAQDGDFYDVDENGEVVDEDAEIGSLFGEQ